MKLEQIFQSWTKWAMQLINLDSLIKNIYILTRVWKESGLKGKGNEI
jgi:hypothetical protein